MAGDDFVAENDPAYANELRGWRKYANSYTMRGRLNIVCLTWGSALLGILYLTRPKKEKAIEAPKAAAKKH